MNSTTLFSKTPPLKLFFIASVPGAVSMLASALHQTLDGVFVGQFVGSTAFAALNLAMPFVIINFSLADLIGVGSAVPISVSLGKSILNMPIIFFMCMPYDLCHRRTDRRDHVHRCASAHQLDGSRRPVC